MPSVVVAVNHCENNPIKIWDRICQCIETVHFAFMLICYISSTKIQGFYGMVDICTVMLAPQISLDDDRHIYFKLSHMVFQFPEIYIFSSSSFYQVALV